MTKDRIISALIGLIGACNNHTKTDNTDAVVIKALAFEQIESAEEEQRLSDILDEIYAEKNLVSPGCAQCAMPCGGTSDYDMERIHNAEEKIRRLKLQILTELGDTAAQIYRCQKLNLLSAETIDFFYKALSYISYDLKEEDLLALCKEAEETKRLIENLFSQEQKAE